MAMNLHERVRFFLAQAEEETRSEDERDTFFQAASKLMAEHNISAELLAQEASQHITATTELVQVFNPFVVPKTSLLNVIAQAFRCNAIIEKSAAHNHGVALVRVFGFKNDIESIKILNTSALIQGAIGSERRRRRGNTSRGYHASYWYGFGNGVKEQLTSVNEVAEKEAEDKTPGTEMVLFSRKQEVDQLVKSTYDRITYTKRRITNSDGFERGKQDGRNADIRGNNKLSNNSHFHAIEK